MNAKLVDLDIKPLWLTFPERWRQRLLFPRVCGPHLSVRPEQPLGRGSALPRLGAELELRRSGSSLGPSQ